MYHKSFVCRALALPKPSSWIGEDLQKGAQKEGKVKRRRRLRRGDIWERKGGDRRAGWDRRHRRE